jgi:3-phenylpropionate/trans-cinnamate dioxygenase ferredoxin reductase subunit
MTMTTGAQTFVIVGASLAGAKAAQTLREEGFDGRIVLVGAEEQRPYARPPLSKEYLRGEAGREKLWVHDDASFYDGQDIELRLGTTATDIDVGRRKVTLDDGERLPFDWLLLTTGAEPRRLNVPGAHLDGVHTLRSVESADTIRARLDRGGTVVVVGAGWIGSEAAASARGRGLDVTVIEPAAVPLERVLGHEMGAFYRDVHRDEGVEMVLGTGVAAFEGVDAVERVWTTDGRAFDCDFAIVGIGVEPRTDLAAAAGLAVGDGVVCDRNLQTSAPGVFAAGDVAQHDHPVYGPTRVEHWSNALHQGPAAARNMLGHNRAYERVPYFFSDQYDVGMEYSGRMTDSAHLVVRGDPATRAFVAFWVDEERLVAAMNVNVWDVAEPIGHLIRQRTRVDDAALRDPAVALEDLAGASTKGEH